ncbi:Pumilio y domain member 6 [Coemansia sp. RSA 2523]|nr:Pumilio y domain member 6 [Coemansia sp. RSA 1591]KAJ1758791.1 Pumilio y domain member 6 [Coemansia sp. RSA 1752]KAJ1806701.1 Pumilio y domain member 6 [Coemansia sp. RSA 2523]KAJ2132645.1 Pumilio y domain member 6 [Coemansia sp. RSA 921]KAJ2170057.1 Pumilio y domain member 6 [Coemansia sp. RSA 560]KAJ2194236.1 Pumilio y domain member 6 [Coemansia sp. RSA 530]KAJ2208057.1 Pumilio y domain member 6 [Coemansia sp. RSA 521]KAJ2281460.1 Pumilio y domain member 6 [Coemansia sp. RSA 451]KAJ228
MAAVDKKTFKREPQTTEDAGSRGQQQKRQRVERQKAQPTGELKIDARKLWEVLRRGDLDAEVRKVKMKEMMDMLRGHIKEVTFKHDMSRVVQTCLKYGNDEQRSEIAAELNGSYVDLSRSQYGRYILMRILKYCPKYRDEVIKSFYGHVRKLVRHKEAAHVLEECFAVYANSKQKWNLVAEFYGREFAVFKSIDGPKSLDAVLATTPQKRETAMDSLKSTVTPLLEKGTVQYSIVHRALLDYIRFADPSERQQVIETMRELVVEILHTRDGAHAAMLCLLYGSVKDRKAMLKAFKPYLQRICCEEYGYAVLVEALDCIDDTVFVNKAVLQDVCGMMSELLADQYGRRIPLFVLGGRNPHYVGSDALQVLADNDKVKALTSKKDASVRRKELTAFVSDSMTEWAAANTTKAIFDPLPSQAVNEILLRAHGDKSAAWQRVLDLVRMDVAQLGADHVLISPIANRVVTNCILAEHSVPKSADSTLPALPESNPKFGSEVLDALVDSEQLVPAACAGAFPVRALLESPVTGERAKQLLRPHKSSIEAAMKEASKKRIFEAILNIL